MSSSPQSQSFDYSALDDATRITVQEHTKEIQSRLVRTAQEMVDIGQQLQAVKQSLKHGLFHDWLRSELGMHPRQANRLVLVARQFNCDNLSQLNITHSALYLLAELKTPIAARQEAIHRAASGEKITLHTAKEIVFRHKKQDPHLSENLVLSIVDISAIAIPDNPPQIIFPKFSIGDHVRILRRQEGEDKWTGCTAKVWEVTPNGWLRVNIEGHQGVRFTLKPEWVELMEKTEMTEAQDHNQPKSIQLEYKPSNDSDTPETFVISSSSFTAQVKCTPSKMIAILAQLGTTPQNAKEP